MRIGVLCSGGDAPGMNACLRAVVRAAIGAGQEVVGIRHGYRGLLNADFFVDCGCESSGTPPLMSARSVGNIVKLGGTILRTSRSERFRTQEGQMQAADVLRKHGIDGLIAMGGDGTFRGAVELARHWRGQIVCCPGTIDNDLMGTDTTIGFQTAVATAVEAVDKLRDTAESHERLFLLEVMGRHSGHLAATTALAAGAEFACVPEIPTDVNELVQEVRLMRDSGKASILIVVAEGDDTGGALKLNEELGRASCPFETRVVILGHVQRGGAPVPVDRILACRLGAFAVNAILDGKTGMMVGEVGGELELTPLPESYRIHKAIPHHLLDLLTKMSS